MTNAERRNHPRISSSSTADSETTNSASHPSAHSSPFSSTIMPIAHWQPPPPRPPRATHPPPSSKVTSPRARIGTRPLSLDSKNTMAMQRCKSFRGEIRRSLGYMITKRMATISLCTVVAANLVEVKMTSLKWSGRVTWSRRKGSSESRRRFYCRAVRG